MRISDWSSDVCSSDLIALLLSGAERDVDDSRRARIRNFGDANRVGLASAWHKQSNTHPHNRVDHFWRSASLSWEVCNDIYYEEIANLSSPSLTLLDQKSVV